MSERLQGYYRKKARGALRSDLAYPLMAFGVSAIAFAVFGLTQLDSPAGLAYLVAAVVFATVAKGMYQCQTWVRWPAAVLLAIGFALAVWAALSDGVSVATLVQTLGCGSGTLYLALPSTGELFEASRAGTPAGAERGSE